jgi:uncharacterized protein YjiS (DUF1127 family)
MADVIALPTARTSGPSRVADGIVLLELWRARRRERAELRRLLRTGRHLLRDIGLAPEQVAAEAAKPFWRG